MSPHLLISGGPPHRTAAVQGPTLVAVHTPGMNLCRHSGTHHRHGVVAAAVGPVDPPLLGLVGMTAGVITGVIGVSHLQGLEAPLLLLGQVPHVTLMIAASYHPPYRIHQGMTETVTGISQQGQGQGQHHPAGVIPGEMMAGGGGPMLCRPHIAAQGGVLLGWMVEAHHHHLLAAEIVGGGTTGLGPSSRPHWPGMNQVRPAMLL
jgi:hypothetical protein